MTTIGWIFMITSWTVISGLWVYCISRVMRSDTGKKK